MRTKALTCEHHCRISIDLSEPAFIRMCFYIVFEREIQQAFGEILLKNKAVRIRGLIHITYIPTLH